MIDYQGGRYRLDRTIIISCGCGGTGPKLRRMVRNSNVDIPIVKTTDDVRLKRYIMQEGLKQQIPTLGDSKHGVLYNPFTGQFINLLAAPETPQLYENIRRVVGV